MGRDVAGPQRSRKAGYLPKTVALWTGTEPDANDALHIATRCQHLQSEMLMWGRGVEPIPLNAFNGTCDRSSTAIRPTWTRPTRRTAFTSARTATACLRRINQRHGHERLSDIKARVLLAWHKDWSAGRQEAGDRIGHHRPAPRPVQFRRDPT
jgi:hypothetical protein